MATWRNAPSDAPPSAQTPQPSSQGLPRRDLCNRKGRKGPMWMEYFSVKMMENRWLLTLCDVPVLFCWNERIEVFEFEFKSRTFLKPFTNEFSKTVILNLGLTVKHHHLMGVSKNRGTPKWMVYSWKLENPIKMDVLGVPLFSETSIFKLNPFSLKHLGGLGNNLGLYYFRCCKMPRATSHPTLHNIDGELPSWKTGHSEWPRRRKSPVEGTVVGLSRYLQGFKHHPKRWLALGFLKHQTVSWIWCVKLEMNSMDTVYIDYDILCTCTTLWQYGCPNNFPACELMGGRRVDGRSILYMDLGTWKTRVYKIWCV